MFYVYLVVALYLFAVALYLLESQSRKHMSLFVCLIFLCLAFYMLMGSMTVLPMTFDQSVLLHRLVWLPGFVGVPAIFYLSILFREKVDSDRKLQRKLFFWFGIPYMVLEASLLFFTKLFFNYSKRIPAEIKIQRPPINEFLTPVIIMQGVWSVLAAYNLYKAFQVSKIKKYYVTRFKFVFIASALFAFCTTVLLALSYLTDLGYISNSYGLPIILSLVLIPSQIVAVLAVAEYNAFVEEGRKITQDLIATLLAFGLWVLLYFGVLSGMVVLSDGKTEAGIFIGVIMVLGVFTHHYHENMKQLIFESLQKGKFTMPVIAEVDVNNALRKYNSPSKLANSKLLKLEVVQLYRKKNSVSVEASLRNLIADVLKTFEPINEAGERTRVRLKYEILRMIIQEQALESQILWELGFDSGSYVRSDKEPDYPVRNNSECKITSIRSYKRLRKEVVNEFRWKLEQREKKALRL